MVELRTAFYIISLPSPFVHFNIADNKIFVPTKDGCSVLQQKLA